MRRAKGALIWLVGLCFSCACTGGAETERTGEPSTQHSGAQAPGPHVELAASGLRDRSTTVLTGGALPQGILQVVECALPPDEGQFSALQDCDLTRASRLHVVADGSGEIRRRIQVRAVIGVGKRREVLCPTAGCRIAVLDGTDRVVASTGISWAAKPNVKPAPTLTLSRIRLGERAGTVTVEGQGYAADKVIYLVQCPPNTRYPTRGISASDCLYDYGHAFKTNSNGGFAGSMRVYNLYQRSDGTPINCRKVPSNCLIANAFPHSNDYRMSWVSFATALR